MVNDILNDLRQHASEAHFKKLAHFGIDDTHAIGVSMPNVRRIGSILCKAFTKQEWDARQQLSIDLWASEIHEARILASIVGVPSLVTPQQMDAWTAEFTSWDLCDQTCANLFQKTNSFLDKAFEYSFHEKEFIKRTGFVLMTQYALHHKKADDAMCLQFLTRIEEEAHDERNFVKKALNWCLRQIGKRNLYLHPFAIETAQRIALQQSRSAKWIASDALRELNDEKILQRLK
ncbi:MAG TPA: DNA alkylation repair protein [Chitinophagaceae bacterium]|nr:DNA alkylation repair protein [Chitinophagaceae bacterium]